MIDFFLLIHVLLSLQLSFQLAQLIIKVVLIDIDIIVPIQHLVHVITLVLELIHLIPEIIQLIHIQISHHGLLLLNYFLHRIGLPHHKNTISIVPWMLSEVKATWSKVNCWFM